MLNFDENHIPGTDHIFRQENPEGLLTDGDIVLIPQPTDSPNDPLNWSKFRKYWHALLVLVVTGLTAATSNSASAAQSALNEDYGYSWGLFNTGAGVLFIGIGYWTLLSSPSVNLWGSRINYLVGMILGIIGNAWYANVKTSEDIVWSQLFIGASESVAEAVVQLSLTEIFYQHQTSGFMGLYILATSVGTYLGPLVGGFAADNLGWQWVGYMGLATSGFVLLILFFGLEETYFDRKHYRNCRKASEIVDPTFEESEHGKKEGDPHTVETTRVSIGSGTVSDSPKSYWQRMAIITPASNLKGWGFKQYLQRLWLTLRVFCFPAVIYSGIQWGTQDAWLTFYITAEDDYWSEKPWNYGDAGVAVMNVPTLIGSIIGCLYGSYVADWFVLYMARRNNGVREAETRLYVILLAGIIAPVGMILFGVGTNNGWSWPVPYVGLGFIGFGWGCAGDLSLSYLIDCYPEMVLEGMVGVSVINNTLGMIFSFVCDHWMSIGPADTFISIGVLEFFVMFVCTIPMIYWGKRARKQTRHLYYSFVEARDSLAS